MHAIAMLSVCGVSLVLRKPWPLVLGAGLSFVGVVAGAVRRWTPSGHFGPANVITSTRLLLLLCLTASVDKVSSITLAVGFLLALLLDILDGYVARRGGHVSTFGASYDMEVDAAFILFAGYLLWLRADHGFSVLVPGLLRYAYVLALIIVPPRGIDRVRSRFGRASFVSTASCLVSALAVGKTTVGILLAEVGVLMACVSFARSFYVAYVSPAKLDWGGTS
jgi:phosphatidylglycerophosphate synthase